MRVLMVPSWQIVSKNRLSPFDTIPICEEALRLWHGGGFDKLLVTGGTFLSPHVQTVSAGALMARWFVAHDVAPTDILREMCSLDTAENISFSLELLEKRGLENACIVVCTQWQHAIRMRITFAAHNVAVDLHPVFLDLPFSQFLWQWICIAYHAYDPLGKKLPAQLIRRSRSHAASHSSRH